MMIHLIRVHDGVYIHIQGGLIDPNSTVSVWAQMSRRLIDLDTSVRNRHVRMYSRVSMLEASKCFFRIDVPALCHIY
jgi:hypothetical protein